MNFVEPIRSTKKIAQIKNLLCGEQRFRDLLLFTVGINTALRASDLLKLQIGDFVDETGQVKDRFWIREEKRGKRHEVVINDSIRDALEVYLAAYPSIQDNPDHFVFFTPEPAITITRSLASRHGSSLLLSARRSGCEDISVHTAYEKPGAIMPG